MGFNLYFAGSRGKSTDEWIATHGANRLFSQLNDRSAIKRYLQYDAKGYLFIDSGAFSAHSRGAEVDVDNYIEYVNQLDDKITIFAQVDKIPGVLGKPRTVREIEEAPEISWQNYLYMRDKVVSPDKLLPVFHQGEDFKWLDNMLEATFDGKHIPYIGISPSNDLTAQQKEPFIRECFAHIKRSSNPNVKTHAFGMTSLNLLERYPFYSADSTTWLLTAGMGNVMTPWGTWSVSDRRMTPDNLLCLNSEARKEVMNYFSSIGYTLEELSSSNEARAIANVIYLTNWAKNYQYKPVRNVKNKLI